ncbi:MAG: hypothetical protein Q4D16_03485 [Eubacteriales bacterium]|nr:hypothetical protein [Eubacteriales bacterium]
MTKHDAIKGYFEPKVMELVGDILSFNFSPESPDSFSLVTEYSDKVVKKFVSGDARKAYGFTIVIIKNYSTSGDDLNLECMNFAQGFMDWIEEQSKQKVYPDFGSDCEIEKMEVLQNMPNLAGINAEAGLAKYMIQCRILYMEHEKDMLGL